MARQKRSAPSAAQTSPAALAPAAAPPASAPRSADTPASDPASDESTPANAPIAAGEVDFGAFARAVIEAAAAAVGVSYDEIAGAIVVSPVGAPTDLEDASAARMDLPPIPDDELASMLAEYRPLAMPGIPVMFREKGRRFNGATTTPAIITRVLEDCSVNLIVLPDGDVPYPRMGVPYEAILDPDALGRAWSHLKIPDD